MDKVEIDWRQREATEQVRSAFYSLNVLLDTFKELAKRRQDDRDIVDAVSALIYVSHDLFNRITIMKMWDGMKVDDDSHSH